MTHGKLTKLIFDLTVYVSYLNVLAEVRSGIFKSGPSQCFLGGTASPSSCGCCLFYILGYKVWPVVSRACCWKLRLVLGFVPSSLHHGQNTGGAYFSSKQLATWHVQ